MYEPIIIAVIGTVVILFLVRIAGIRFEIKTRKLEYAARKLGTERFKWIEERHKRDEKGNYIHGDPVRKGKSEMPRLDELGII